MEHASHGHFLKAPERDVWHTYAVRSGAFAAIGRMTRKDTDKPALAQRIEMLTGELTAIDAARAVALD
jgi:hypothetical protein